MLWSRLLGRPFVRSGLTYTTSHLSSISSLSFRTRFGQRGFRVGAWAAVGTAVITSALLNSTSCEEQKESPVVLETRRLMQESANMKFGWWREATKDFDVDLVDLSGMDKKTFEKKIMDTEDMVLLDIYSPWCPVCARMEIVMNQVAHATKGERLRIYLADTDTIEPFFGELEALPLILMYPPGKKEGILKGIPYDEFLDRMKPDVPAMWAAGLLEFAYKVNFHAAAPLPFQWEYIALRASEAYGTALSQLDNKFMTKTMKPYGKRNPCYRQAEQMMGMFELGKYGPYNRMTAYRAWGMCREKYPESFQHIIEKMPSWEKKQEKKKWQALAKIDDELYVEDEAMVVEALAQE